MLFLDQNFTFFRMVHLDFLEVVSYRAENGVWIQAQFRWIVFDFPVHNIKLTAKQGAPLERACNFGLETTLTFWN